MENVTRQDMEQAISKASREVFDTMLHLPFHIGSSEMRDRIQPEVFHGVVALVGIAGTWTGTSLISCSARFAQQLAGALLATAYDSVNEEVLDAVAEVANMIIGNVKTIFEESLGPLALTIPTVIYGRNYHARSAGVKDWVMVRLHSGKETMDIYFCLMPSRVPHLAHRGELQTV